MELDCGIAPERIASWLSEELSLDCANGRWTFAFDGTACQVTAEPLSNRSYGGIPLARTLVAIDGHPAAVDEFYRLFMLRFISAGG